jgi:predicted RNA binding protein YcfA (HicA-like mRNA interferase family)
MTKPEIDRNKLVSRLKREGWVSEGGAKHDKFAHPDRPGVKIMVPRHNPLTPGVARNIAVAADW